MQRSFGCIYVLRSLPSLVLPPQSKSGLQQRHETGQFTRHTSHVTRHKSHVTRQVIVRRRSLKLELLLRQQRQGATDCGPRTTRRRRVQVSETLGVWGYKLGSI